MKGLFPWIREALFGPAKLRQEVCRMSSCYSLRHPDCGSGHCALHHAHRCHLVDERGYYLPQSTLCKVPQPADPELEELKKMIQK